VPIPSPLKTQSRQATTTRISTSRVVAYSASYESYSRMLENVQQEHQIARIHISTPKSVAQSASYENYTRMWEYAQQECKVNTAAGEQGRLERKTTKLRQRQSALRICVGTAALSLDSQH
jgi:hypothetical protein